MVHDVKKNHPRSTFSCQVAGRHLADDILMRMQSVIDMLARSRTWVIGPPTLVDEHEGDVRIIGGTVDLYTAIPPFGADLPKEVDRQHFEEVTAIVDALAAFSRETGLEVSFAFDQTYVGRIENGEPDKLIRVGLLGEWRKAHGLTCAPDPRQLGPGEMRP